MGTPHLAFARLTSLALRRSTRARRQRTRAATRAPNRGRSCCPPTAAAPRRRKPRRVAPAQPMRHEVQRWRGRCTVPSAARGAVSGRVSGSSHGALTARSGRALAGTTTGRLLLDVHRTAAPRPVRRAQRQATCAAVRAGSANAVANWTSGPPPTSARAGTTDAPRQHAAVRARGAAIAVVHVAEGAQKNPGPAASGAAFLPSATYARGL